jgi:ABC-type dipeptide/oligopeptide/nickel transport system ATPase component
MLRIAQASLLDAWTIGDGDQAAAAIQQFGTQYSEDLREQSPASRSDENAYREWERNVSRWLYSVKHISLAYDLEYDGLNVQRLSPGSRGIVLLLLYLAVDQSETDPLIIDQPEENLDPKSVYSELVALFRAASERRQIIMVTHNANLVVNTDVDQVIVAHCDGLEEGKLPKLSYIAGGLEDSTVRQAVCDVLEGGAEAFRQRARRLHIDAPSTRVIDD